MRFIKRQGYDERVGHLPVILMRITLVLWLCLPLFSFSQLTMEEFQSKQTGDLYEILIKKPKGFDSAKAYNIVFFTDGNMNSGKTILGQNDETVKNCILVGIGHKGNWKMKRQRDFIPSGAGGYSHKEFGQAAKFFEFVRLELIPWIDGKFKKRKKRVFIGHSFGGLLALYMSLRENRIFDHYYAISPSVWANHGELMKIEKDYFSGRKEYNSNITIYAGSLEIFNKVLSSSKKFYNTTKERNYKGFSISLNIESWVNHYGIVSKIIPEIFGQLK